MLSELIILHRDKADCSRYVAVYDNKEVFEQFPELKTLGTAKIFALLSNYQIR